MAQRLDPQRTQRQDPDHHRGHAIRVVVAPDGDPLTAVDRPLHPVERHIGIGHQGHVVERGLARGQEAAEVLVIAEPAPRQEGRHRCSEPGE